MIGQEQLIDTMIKQVKHHTFPRFSIVTGPKGSGKKELVKLIVKHLQSNVVYESKIGVSDVRDAINQMYKVNDLSVFVFYDVDGMSIQAKNALLKAAEEPPRQVYIIMTVSDMSTVLDTIKSRAQIYYMQPYTSEEIDTYYHDFAVDRKSDAREIVRDLCETPGDVELLCKNGAYELWEYARLTVDSIAAVSGANAFKMTQKLAFKEGDEGFDLLLFLKAFRQICTNRMLMAVSKQNTDDINHYATGIEIVGYIIRQLSLTGINKVALIDIFILDIRKAWM